MANNMTSATLKVIFSATQAKAVDVIGTPGIALEKSVLDRLTAGTGAAQGNLCYTRRLSIAASGNASIDLAGALLDAYGDAAVFAKVKAILIHNLSDEASPVSAAQVTLSGNFMNVITGGTAAQVLGAGDWVAEHCSKAGLTVTNTSADTITVTNNSGSEIATVDIVVLGNA